MPANKNDYLRSITCFTKTLFCIIQKATAIFDNMRAIGRSKCKNQLIAVISHASHPLYDVIRKLTRQRNKSTINETILTINVELRFSFQKFGLFGLHRSLGVCSFMDKKTLNSEPCQEVYN